jgi:hypothetical protein
MARRTGSPSQGMARALSQLRKQGGAAAPQRCGERRGCVRVGSLRGLVGNLWVGDGRRGRRTLDLQRARARKQHGFPAKFCALPLTALRR